MAIFFIFLLTFSTLVDEDDNGKFRLERVKKAQNQNLRRYNEVRTWILSLILTKADLICFIHR